MSLLKYGVFFQEKTFCNIAALGKQFLLTVLVSSGELTVSFLCRKFGAVLLALNDCMKLASKFLI